MVDERQGPLPRRSRPASWARPTIEILDGLKEGEEIVTGSYKTLRTLKDQAQIKVERRRSKSS